MANIMTMPIPTGIDSTSQDIKWISSLKNIVSGFTTANSDSETYDAFTYPSLELLRKDFEASGLYTKAEIDAKIKVYERLPKYRTGSRSAPRGKKRS